MINTLEQYEMMIDQEVERLVDAFTNGGDTKINTTMICITFEEADPFEVYKDIAKQVTVLLDAMQYDSGEFYDEESE